MAENEQNDKPVNNYIKYSALGFQMIGVIALFTFVGYKIDESAGHETKWVTAILSLVGVFASLYLVFRSVKN